jgi:hypothetical protein
MYYKVSRLCSVVSGVFGTGSLSGGGPSVAFIEPSVPLVLTLRSGRPVTGAGVEQAAAIISRKQAVYNFFMFKGLV